MLVLQVVELHYQPDEGDNSPWDSATNAFSQFKTYILILSLKILRTT
jgi:hypothetical protein